MPRVFVIPLHSEQELRGIPRLFNRYGFDRAIRAANLNILTRHKRAGRRYLRQDKGKYRKDIKGAAHALFHSFIIYALGAERSIWFVLTFPFRSIN